MRVLGSDLFVYLCDRHFFFARAFSPCCVRFARVGALCVLGESGPGRVRFVVRCVISIVCWFVVWETVAFLLVRLGVGFGVCV